MKAKSMLLHIMMMENFTWLSLMLIKLLLKLIYLPCLIWASLHSHCPLTIVHSLHAALLMKIRYILTLSEEKLKLITTVWLSYLLNHQLEVFMNRNWQLLM